MDFAPSESVSTQRAPLSKEAQFYYAGLPSVPRLVGRSSTIVWEAPSGPEAYPRHKVLGTVGRHAINNVWEGNLSCKVVEHLDSKKVAWTSIDVVRISYVEESFRPVILWIGVQPESLSVEDGTEVARSCQEILVQSGIIDVDVEIRESFVTPLAGPKLLEPTVSSDATVDLRNPLTPTLGLPISGKLTPYSEGTGGFFISEGGGSKRLFLVTARHVVFKSNRNDNRTFEHKSRSAPCREVILLGDAAFTKFLASIKLEIGGKAIIIPYLERRIADAKDMAGDRGEKERKKAGDELAEAKEAVDALNTFYGEVSTHWASPDRRVLGHVIYSPPIVFGFGTEQYTQDFAVIEIDPSKIDSTNFEGNVIDLGTKIQPDVFTRMMYPNLRNAHIFEYPKDRLLRLKGTIPDKDMRHPPALDQNDEPCLMVIKHGNATGLTVGLANDIRSCVRNYHEGDTTHFSMEWAILPLDNNSGAFSKRGDSGAVVADGGGRIGGIITGGAGWRDESDITYVSSINSIMESIKVKFPKAHLNPNLRT
ncbi:hypothetical protein L873DRAFT_1847409 [Choiromyces venosus 120613-1]|uniref:Trypsin-like serine protease n=1 Tax=Choiromyces venosus 120613-1 TaxID=1336337 RepID=A0A3N4J4G5_9PEZI|nr:hypothetical protein L873DRAFT_1847409 [Choiromyces venosus 120613-1]